MDSAGAQVGSKWDVVIAIAALAEFGPRCFPDHGIVDPNRFLPTFGHTASPPEEQARRNTMTAGYVGNRHPGLGCFGQNRQLLVQRVPPATLDAGKNFDSINIRHSRMTRLTPSPSLCSYVRFKRGRSTDLFLMCDRSDQIWIVA